MVTPALSYSSSKHSYSAPTRKLNKFTTHYRVLKTLNPGTNFTPKQWQHSPICHLAKGGHFLPTIAAICLSSGTPKTRNDTRFCPPFCFSFPEIYSKPYGPEPAQHHPPSPTDRSSLTVALITVPNGWCRHKNLTSNGPTDLSGQYDSGRSICLGWRSTTSEFGHKPFIRK